ncbi:MAG: 2-oxoacid:acceptor oxidoreductase family protein [Deltaproteobacteria bacterium]|nr:2-oxoacid:acceptor oxidoreductase family protein [Deltaproteobacteria bacterium]
MKESSTERFSALLVGVGGQGVLTAAQILGDAAHEAGLNVTVGQLHGMSQRGGSVACTVLIGPGSSSWIIGQADVVLAFEPLEALRALPSIGKRTRVVMNTGVILPPAVLVDAAEYPDQGKIIAHIEGAAGALTLVDGPALVSEVGEARTLNTILLGALAGLDLLPFGGELLGRVADARLPDRYQERNQRAFELGQRAI